MALCTGGPRFSERDLCGCFWCMSEMEQITFKVAPGCGTCTFGFPVSKSDLQALSRRRTLSCACSAAVPGSGKLCPVTVAKTSHSAATEVAPVERIQSGHVELPEIGCIGLNGSKNYWSCLSGHGHKQWPWQASSCG